MTGLDCSVSVRGLAWTFLPSILVLGGVAAVSVAAHEPVGTFTRDIAATAHVHPLTGVVSNLGVLLWCAAAVVCLFTAQLLRAGGRGAAAERRFFVAGALLSGYLLLDDFFMIHDVLAKRHLHVNEKLVYASIVVAVLLFLWHFRRRILGRPVAYLVLACGFLGASVLTDLVLGKNSTSLNHWVFLLEDGFKLLGISAWCAYFFSSALDSLGCAERSPAVAGGVSAFHVAEARVATAESLN